MILTKKIMFFLGLVFLGLTACNDDDLTTPPPSDIAPTISLNDCYALGYGESVIFEDEGWLIRFDSLVEDSRCPDTTFVDCVWAGRAWAKLTIVDQQTETQVDLITENSINLDSLTVAYYGDYVIVLQDINPYPFMPGGDVVELDDYEVDFCIYEAESYSDCAPVIVDGDVYDSVESDQFFWSHVVIEDDCMHVTISSSGCDGLSWDVKLIDSGAIAESLPEQRYLRLDFSNTEACLAQFERTFSFDLTELQTSNPEVILNIDGWEDTLLYSY